MSGHGLRVALREYLAVRRALGFKLVRDGLLLEQFVGFCELADAERITRDLAVAWVTSPRNPSPSWLSMRLGVVRGFALWLQAADPATEVPERGWLPPRRRSNPYIYSDGDIAALLDAARRVRWPLSAATYHTLFGLLAVTGLRIGEAIRLDRDDVSLTDRVITITDSKLGKSRQVSLHPTTVTALDSYLDRRRALSPTPNAPALFVHPAGQRIVYLNVCRTFRVLVERAGVVSRSEHCRPTIHGLRHTFAVNTLIGWYRDGVDVQARLATLSTWLGHADPKWTYWYLSATTELLMLANDRVEAAWRPEP